MENFIPHIVGLAAYGASYWTRSRIARAKIGKVTAQHEEGNWRLKKDLADTVKDYDASQRNLNRRLDDSVSLQDMHDIHRESVNLAENHTRNLARHKFTSDYYNNMLGKLKKDLKLIKNKVPFYLAIASLGLAGYEAITGKYDLAIGLVAFAAPHLLETVATQNM